MSSNFSLKDHFIISDLSQCRLLLVKDFRTVVAHLPILNTSVVIYKFPKFLTLFVKDVALFPGILAGYLREHQLNDALTFEELIRKQEQFVGGLDLTDLSIYVTQPYNNPGEGSERIEYLIKAFRHQRKPKKRPVAPQKWPSSEVVDVFNNNNDSGALTPSSFVELPSSSHSNFIDLVPLESNNGSREALIGAPAHERIVELNAGEIF